MDALLKKAYDKLKVVREDKDIQIRNSTYLKDKIVLLDGREIEFKLRYYQAQMVIHLLTMKRFVVGDDTGLGKCVSGDTLMRTNKGLVRIDSLMNHKDMTPDTFEPYRGTHKISIKGKEHPIKNVYYGGVKPTKKITTTRGYQIIGSLIHPLLVLRNSKHQWIEAQNLREGDYLCVDRSDQAFGERSSLSADFARFLGYYLAEGSLTNEYQVCVTQCPNANPEIQADIQRLFKVLFGAEVYGKEMRFGSRSVREDLARLGFGYTHSHDHVIPPCILEADRETVRCFLSALFEGECSVSDVVEFSTSSEILAKQLQILLLGFGVVCSRKPKRVKGYSHTYWRLTLCGEDVARFEKEIGLISTRKRDALRGITSKKRNTNLDVVPHVTELVESCRSKLIKVLKGKGGLKSLGVSVEKTFNNLRNGGRNPTYSFLGRIGAVLEKEGCDNPFEEVLATQYFYDPILSIEDGEQEVFDVEVESEEHAFVGNGLVNHNTLEAIATLCYLWEADSEKKVIVMTNKSVVGQWASEFDKFTEGVTTYQIKGTKKKRRKQLDEFWGHEGSPAVAIMGYRSACSDFEIMQDWTDFNIVFDEATAFKTPTTQVHQVCKHIASNADRAFGLTATLIKNNLLEGWGIYKVIVPDLFTPHKSAFVSQFCVTKLQKIKGGRKIPVIVGYRKKDIVRFREMIDPFYLGRPKHSVASELPVLTTKKVRVGMTNFQHQKYIEALTGLLELGTGEEKEVTKLTSIIYCQEIANHPCLIECDGASEKYNTLESMLTEGGELHGEKVIVYTRFRKLVDHCIPLLKKKKIQCVRVTGSENEDERKEAQDIFQNLESGINVIWLTAAGGEAINLQSAKAIIFYDSPWSAGDYLQILGRMIRIGSPNDRCYAIHLVCDDTVDERVMEVLSKKMKLVEGIIGKRLIGEEGATEEDENSVITQTSEISDIFSALQSDARKKK